MNMNNHHVPPSGFWAAMKTDLSGLWMIAATSMVVGLLINQVRSEPLPLTYQTPEERVLTAAARLGGDPAAAKESLSLPEYLSITEVREYVGNDNAILLDARPEIFHRLGHIPGALSLPRESFEEDFQRLREDELSDTSAPIIVYCSSASCPDADIVRRGLEALGYRNVTVYKGGWEEFSRMKDEG